MKTCSFCGKECGEFRNYCSWDCSVEEAKRSGGVVHAPNGLPIRCVKHDGSMYEHEHGDHPDYKYPVQVLFTGEVTDDHRHDYEMLCGKPPENDDECRRLFGETHALLYTDGNVALTMYECCYAMWYCLDGACGGGRFWKPGNWKLDLTTLRPIK